jgi:hypothetical protein
LSRRLAEGSLRSVIAPRGHSHGHSWAQRQGLAMAAVSVVEVRAEHSVRFSPSVALHVLSLPFPLQYRPCRTLFLAHACSATSPLLHRLRLNRRVQLAYSAGLSEQVANKITPVTLATQKLRPSLLPVAIGPGCSCLGAPSLRSIGEGEAGFGGRAAERTCGLGQPGQLLGTVAGQGRGEAPVDAGEPRAPSRLNLAGKQPICPWISSAVSHNHQP